MKTKILVIMAIALLLLSASFAPALAVQPDEEADKQKEIQKINKQLNKLLKISDNLPNEMLAAINSGKSAPARYPIITEYERVGIVYDDIAEYRIQIKVGPEEYDSETLTCYIKETRPWRSESDKNLVIFPGQFLTKDFYSDTKTPESMAIYYAQQEYNVYVLDRREINVPIEETDFSYMQDWTMDTYLSDTYYGIIVSRIHTAILSRNNINDIEVSAIGCSLGAMILTKYEASDYDDMFLGSVDKIVPIDIVIKYDPANTKLVQTQADRFNAVTSGIESGIYQNDEMAGMMYLAQLAYTDPSGDSFIMPGLTNIQVFRLMASQTYIFDPYPFTPDFHYWTGDLNGLFYVNEDRVLLTTLTGGAVPYSPLVLDQYMAGLMGDIEGYEINSAKVDSPTLYVGLGGGFSHYGAWWFTEEAGKTNNEVTAIDWNNQGHASSTLDYNAPELWTQIGFWLKNN